MQKIIQGNVLDIIRTFNPNTFDAVITDPPYSSGGPAAVKTRPTAEKYTSTKKACPFPDFPGDARDQRSWTSWCAEWMDACRVVSKPGAIFCVFIDWRQLPSLTDAIQWADWTWRGIVVWDKANSRPQKGRFRQDTEYIAWASKGALPPDRPVPVLPGCYRGAMPQASKRSHQTQKPLEVMRQIVRICEPGGHILDPFAGSGTTLEAAKMEGYDCTGIEMMPEYATVIRQRLGL